MHFTEGLRVIVKASRPPGWCFGPILFLIGLILSPSPPRNLHALFTAAPQTVALSFPLCTIVFGINDVYDYETDSRNPRKLAAGLEGGVLAPAYHSSVRLAAQISTAVIFITSLATRKSQNIVATALLLIFSWQYSAPPLRLKEVPVLDSLSNGLIVFFAWFVGYAFGRGTLSNVPNKGYVLALCTVGMHALGAVVDIDSDVVAGQRTIATFLGPYTAVTLSALPFALSASTQPWNSIFGIYLRGGLITLLLPLFHLQWAHLAFQIIVYWSVSMSALWCVSKVLIMQNLLHL